jgi:hypothetical protein
MMITYGQRILVALLNIDTDNNIWMHALSVTFSR